MKKIFLLSLLAAGLAGCCNSGQKQAAEQAVWPKLQATGEMPILAWHSIPSDCTTLERFREMKETGITHSVLPVIPMPMRCSGRWIRRRRPASN